MQRLLNLSNVIRENLSSAVEITSWEPGQSTAFAYWNQDKPETHPLVWFDSLWVSSDLAPVEIKLLDQMVKLILELIFLELQHRTDISRVTAPKNCKLRYNNVVSNGQILPVELCIYLL